MLSLITHILRVVNLSLINIEHSFDIDLDAILTEIVSEKHYENKRFG